MGCVDVWGDITLVSVQRNTPTCTSTRGILRREHTGLRSTLISQVRLPAGKAWREKDLTLLLLIVLCKFALVFRAQIAFWPTSQTSAIRKLHFCPKKIALIEDECVYTRIHVWLMLMYFKTLMHIKFLLFFPDRSWNTTLFELYLYPQVKACNRGTLAQPRKENLHWTQCQAVSPHYMLYW